MSDPGGDMRDLMSMERPPALHPKHSRVQELESRRPWAGRRVESLPTPSG